uniref:Uncharacterized protein n=1 Tax=Siphoviridae sp. ctKHH22 TaxID=2825439 RepID=A0A8S5Q164_9CAUD|nr:MAG TPA: hypothetical protein [Siphoviridae sp. ctKHH22]
MDRNQAKEFYPILKAYAEGRVIECRTEPKYRPFKDAEECWNEMLKHKPFGWIFSRKTGTAHLIRCIDDNHVFTAIQYSFDSAFKNFVFADLVPFGVKVEE